MPPLLRRIAVVLALPVALIATWWFTSAGSQNFYFPPLQTILDTFAKLWFSSQAIPNVLPSLARFSVGYLAAAFLGIAIGVPVGASRDFAQRARAGARIFARHPAAGIWCRC